MPEWSLENIPPEGHKDVADFVFKLFEKARAEKERLNKPSDFLSNYALYRGKQMAGEVAVQRAYTPVNLYFANIERTVSNITARNPTGEVVDLDGRNDGAEDLFSKKLKTWWKDFNQQAKTRATARAMEIYGITIEKPVWDTERHNPDVILTDPFAFFPAPGLWEDLATDPPYICFVYLDFVDKVESKYGVTGVAEDDAYQLLGLERERYKTDNYQVPSQQRIGNYDDPMYRVNRADQTSSDKAFRRCLVIEVWLKDHRKREEKVEEPVVDDDQNPVTDENGKQMFYQVKRKVPVYPDGIRHIIIVRSEAKSRKASDSTFMVLADTPNPNINPEMPEDLARNTHPWGRFPVITANSYRDLISIWGFSAAEQVGDLVVKINRIVSKLITYVINVMAPPLIVQKHCGISRAMIENAMSKGGRLILMPTTPNARIEFMQIPNLPATFFQVLDLIIKLFDRVYQIEDADRGQAPKQITAAAAIIALQERNQVLMKAKTTSIDYIAEQRSRWAIGLWQNYHTENEIIEINDEPIVFRATDFVDRRFSYVVEAGSTTPRTSLQIQEIAQALYQMNAIDRQALLETINFPDYRRIIERMGETKLDEALGVLVEAGMSQEEAMALKNALLEPQGGPGQGINQGQGGGAVAPPTAAISAASRAAGKTMTQ